MAVKKPKSRPVDGAIPLTLDRKRYLLLDFNALALIEEETGKSTLDPEFWNNFPKSAKDIRLFMWAALKRDDPDLTIEAVGNLIHPGVMEDINAALTLTMMESMPEAEETAPGKAKAAGKNKRSRTG